MERASASVSLVDQTCSSGWKTGILVGLSAAFLGQEVLLIKDHGLLMCQLCLENEMLALFCVVWEHNWFEAPRKTSLTHWLQGRFELMADVCFPW